MTRSRTPWKFLTVAAAVLVAGCGVTPPSGTGSASPSAATSNSPTSRPTASATARPTVSATSPGRPEPVDCRRSKCLALTFDDGPGEQTGKLLDLLAKEQVPATFFLLGRNLKLRPELARRMATMPSITLGNHTLTHPMLTKISARRAATEVRENTRLIERLTGIRVVYFRPPYGLRNARIDRLAKAQGQAVVLWSNGALDWEDFTAAKVVHNVMAQARSGGIVLLHDIHPWTIKAVPTLIRRLRAKGYVLVGLDALLPAARPGKVYWQQTIRA